MRRKSATLKGLVAVRTQFRGKDNKNFLTAGRSGGLKRFNTIGKAGNRPNIVPLSRY